MKSHMRTVAFAAIILMLVLTGCNLRASTPPPPTQTSVGEVPFPFDQETTEDPVSLIATQTAQAEQPGVIPPPGGEGTNPEIVIETNTPEPGVEPQQPAEGSTDNPPPATTDNQTGGGIDTGQQVQGGQNEPAASNPTPVIARPQTYTLQRGEWPYCIARRYNLDLASFLSANGMNNNSRPGAGTVLVIPASGNWGAQYGSRSLAAHPTTYTVQAGDSVNSIACKFGDVAPESILAVNGLSSASDIKAGMKISIP